MHHSFVPLLLLLLAPLAWGLHRLGLLGRAWGKRSLLLCGLAVLAAAGYEGGTDFAQLNQMRLLPAGATALLLLLHHFLGLPGRRAYLTGLAVTAVLSWTIYLNFFSFHGARTFLHIHDVAHYYLGTKYFDELSYGRLYTAMLRAEAELYENRFKSIEARDLETTALLHIRALLVRSDPVKARFTEGRWKDFCADVAFFREAMGQQYGEILRDHGYNAPPSWTLLGGTLAQWVPAGSGRGIRALTALDPLLQLGMFAAVLWAFGLEACLLTLIYFTVLFGSSFGWMGGAYLRHLWLFCLVVCACGLQRGRFATAGALLATASLLRIFPAAFLLPLLLRAGLEWRSTGRPDRGLVRFFAAFAAAGTLFFAATLARHGWQSWDEFGVNLQRHMRNTAYNTVGLTPILAWNGPAAPASDAEMDELMDRRDTARLVRLGLLLPATLLLVAVRSRRGSAVQALALGSLVAFVGIDLAAYYGTFLLVVLLAHAGRPRALALLFVAEAILACLQVFEDRQQVLYLYRNVLLALVLADLYLIGDRAAQPAPAAEAGGLTAAPARSG